MKTLIIAILVFLGSCCLQAENLIFNSSAEWIDSRELKISVKNQNSVMVAVNLQHESSYVLSLFDSAGEELFSQGAKSLFGFYGRHGYLLMPEFEKITSGPPMKFFGKIKLPGDFDSSKVVSGVISLWVIEVGKDDKVVNLIGSKLRLEEIHFEIVKTSK